MPNSSFFLLLYCMVCVIARNRVKECKMKPCFCQPIQFSLKLCWQNVAKNIKRKILTANFQAVRIFLSAPDRNTICKIKWKSLKSKLNITTWKSIFVSYLYITFHYIEFYLIRLNSSKNSSKSKNCYCNIWQSEIKVLSLQRSIKII